MLAGENKKYRINPVIWFVKDEETTKFHVHRDDYFGTIATILDLVKQSVDKDRPANRELIEKTLENLEKDLLFLQENYKIIGKDEFSGG